MSITLWIVQGLLALVFLFAGGMKLVMSPEEMAAGTPFPGVFYQFIGVCEVLGAFGLILPGLLKIKPGLTPLAAAGLTIIMAGATVLTAIGMGGVGVPPATAVIPLVIGLLAAFVAYGRWHLAPQHKHAPADELQPAH
ncbi:MAG TPA: DoxX family protein [Chloroflexota bacterium]|nr:DoxX family protein [Chloroflexota bacterium]